MDTIIAWLIEGQLYCPRCCKPDQDEIDCGHASPRFGYYSPYLHDDLAACCGTCGHTIACCAGAGIQLSEDCFECSVVEAVAGIKDAVFRWSEYIRATEGDGVAAEALRRFKANP